MCSASKQVHKKPGERITGTADLNEQAKEHSHKRTNFPMYKWGVLTGSCQSLLGNELGISQQVVTQCSVHHL